MNSLRGRFPCSICFSLNSQFPVSSGEDSSLMPKWRSAKRSDAAFGHYPALGLEGFTLHASDARRDEVFGCRKEHGKKALYDQIVELRFRLGEVPRPLDRGDDREVVGDLLVVEYALVGLDPALLQDQRRVPRVA